MRFVFSCSNLTSRNRGRHSTPLQAINRIRYNQKYLNNIVEQDHRGVKRVTRPRLGFKSFTAAQDTLGGVELMDMIKKRQPVVEGGDEGRNSGRTFSLPAALDPLP